MESQLYTIYKNTAVPALKQAFGYKNVMEVPRIEKVVLNVGFGRHAKENTYVENIENTLRAITGQKPVLNKAKKSISNFKIREGTEIGASVTLRGKKMYEFLYKTINLALPRVRDFRGINTKSFDGNGNYTFGLKENIAFPEITADSVDKIHGLEIVICTTAKTDKEARVLLGQLGFPFNK